VVFTKALKLAGHETPQAYRIRPKLYVKENAYGMTADKKLRPAPFGCWAFRVDNQEVLSHFGEFRRWGKIRESVEGAPPR